MYSYLISSGINFIVEYLSLSEDSIISIKTNKIINYKKKKEILRKIKIKQEIV